MVAVVVAVAAEHNSTRRTTCHINERKVRTHRRGIEMPYGEAYNGSMFKKKSSGVSDATYRTGYQADILRKYPLGSAMARPLFNDHRKRYGGSTTGGSIGSMGGGGGG